MIINVFIPTYKRLKTLDAVLYSLIKVRLPESHYSYICYVVNNFPENKTAVDNLITKFNKMSETWDIQAIHREKTLPPVTNWYGAISDYTSEGDIAFLQGDDDLFLPDSISFRVKAILDEQADLLLTTQAGGILFYDDTNEISIDGFRLNILDETIRQIDWSGDQGSAIFIGNNTYRMTPLLKKAFKQSMEWSEAQDWLTYDQRTLMYPVYIPIALIFLEGKVIRSQKQCVICGKNADELRRALWSTPGWNSGFLHLSYLGVLNNPDLNSIRELDKNRKSANDYVATWYWTFFLDPRISKEVRNLTFKKIGKPTFTVTTVIDSFIFLAQGLLYKYKYINSLKNWVKGKRNMVEVSTFIDRL